MNKRNSSRCNSSLSKLSLVLNVHGLANSELNITIKVTFTLTRNRPEMVYFFFFTATCSHSPGYVLSLLWLHALILMATCSHGYMLSLLRLRVLRLHVYSLILSRSKKKKQQAVTLTVF